MNRLKNISLIFLLLSFLFSFIISCDSTDPKPPEKPPGYQEDIPWPSLADSPWPIYRGDPQSTGRTKVKGPDNGIVNLELNVKPEIHSSIIINLNNSFLVTTSYPGNSISSFSLEGVSLWEKTVAPSSTSVLAENSGDIYYLTNRTIQKLSKDGESIWSVELGTNAQQSENINIDKLGNIYFISSNYSLNAYSKNGVKLWSLYDSEFITTSNSLSFSPNGSTIYCGGELNSVIAVDISSKSIKWRSGAMPPLTSIPRIRSTPVITSNGNILSFVYLNSTSKNLVMLDENGDLLWEKRNISVGYENQLSINKLGDIYYSEVDTIVAVNYLGEEKWRSKLNGVILTDLCCDSEGNIYCVIRSESNEHYAVKTSSNGDVIWNTFITSAQNQTFEQTPTIAEGLLIIPTDNHRDVYIII